MSRLSTMLRDLANRLDKRHAPFCSNPDCPCAVADPQACPEFMGEYDSAGVMRCARCGNLKRKHRR